MSPSLRYIGRYAMSEQIASGGMASVHLGRLMASAGFARTVVIKRMLNELADNREFVAMFVDEACLAARIRHPNVVSTLDVIREGKEMLIVMDYVHGASFEALLRTSYERERPVPVGIASAVVTQGLLGLDAAHEARSETGEPLGIVHRDFSPHNLLIDVHGIAKVADFGVAKAIQKLHTTKEGQVKGKWSYMSPEQVAGEEVDRRSDVFAAGIVLWEALTLKRLFGDPHPAKVATAIAFTETEAPSQFVAGVSPELDAVVLRALAKDPEERFASAREMAEALRQVCPLADSLTMSQWVTDLAASELERRAELVSQLERATVNKPKVPSSAAVSLLESSGELVDVIAKVASSRGAMTRRDTPIVQVASETHRSETGAVVAATGVQGAVAAAASTRVSDTGLSDMLRDAAPPASQEASIEEEAPITVPPRGLKGQALSPALDDAYRTSAAPPSSGELATVPNVLEAATGTIPPTLEAPQHRRSRKGVWAALVLVLAIGGGAGAYWQLVYNADASSSAKKKKKKKARPKTKKKASPKPSVAPQPLASSPAPTTATAAASSAAPVAAPPSIPRSVPKPRVNCAKPYYEKDGIRVYREECL